MDDNNNKEVDVNRKNREQFEDLMDKSGSNRDVYFDKNNPIVRIVKLILFLIIVGAFVYYLLTYLNL